MIFKWVPTIQLLASYPNQKPLAMPLFHFYFFVIVKIISHYSKINKILKLNKHL